MNSRRISEDEILQNLANLPQITFEVTDACNLACKYCGYGELYDWYDKRTNSYLTFLQVKKIIDYIVDLWSEYPNESINPVTFFSFYGGEPLLNMQFIKETVAYVESLQLPKNIFFSMTTNGLLLDQAMDYLKAKNFRLLISLDGNKYANGYRVDRQGKESFDRVIHNIELLRNTYPSYYTQNVRFNAVLHSRNNVNDIRKFYKEILDKENIMISELNTAGIRHSRKKLFEQIYRNKMKDLLSSENRIDLSDDLADNPANHQLLAFLQKYSGNIFDNYIDLFMDPKEKQYTPTGTCIPFSRKMFITVNGKILPCERINHQFSYGMVDEHGLDFDISQIVKQFNHYLDQMQPQCTACYNKESCAVCLYNMLQDGKLHCDKFLCKNDYQQLVSSSFFYLTQHPHLYKKLMTEVIEA
ncbi:MAG: radical SAM peptide maturase [Bacteroides sp.]|nr:radical SAM peptide maturase [Bacteroides sp.]MCM1084757.1 radical SAM peptide maturase [Bacteroides sp.]